MSHRGQAAAPSARAEGLLVEELGDETVVYDVARHEAHALSAVAAAVFALADGRRSVAELARLATERLTEPVTDDQVWEALVQLEDCGLLEEPEGGISRRDMFRVGTAAGAGVLITSLAMPALALAASCNIGTTCDPSVKNGSPCSGVRNKTYNVANGGICNPGQPVPLQSAGGPEPVPSGTLGYNCADVVIEGNAGGNTQTCLCYTGAPVYNSSNTKTGVDSTSGDHVECWCAGDNGGAGDVRTYTIGTCQWV